MMASMKTSMDDGCNWLIFMWKLCDILMVISIGQVTPGLHGVITGQKESPMMGLCHQV